MSFFSRPLFLILTAIFFVVLIPHVSLAQPNLKKDISAQIDKAAEKGQFKTSDKPQEIIVEIIQAMLKLVGMIFVALTVYAGYLRFTSHGMEERVEKSTDVMTMAVIGLLIVLLSYAITLFVAKRIYQAATTEDVYEVGDEPSFTEVNLF